MDKGENRLSTEESALHETMGILIQASIRFLMKVTALSPAQVTRLIARWMDCREVRRKPGAAPE